MSAFVGLGRQRYCEPSGPLKTREPWSYHDPEDVQLLDSKSLTLTRGSGRTRSDIGSVFWNR